MLTETFQIIRTRHLVRLIDFCDQGDPLNQNGGRNYFGNWIYLEYLEHGTLAQFVEKCDAQGIPYVPNRLLWRMFLCRKYSQAPAWNQEDTSRSEDANLETRSDSSLHRHGLHPPRTSGRPI